MTDLSLFLSLSLSLRNEPSRILRDARALLAWRHRRAIDAFNRLRRWLKI